VATTQTKAVPLAERELILKRVLNAPPELVYRAWTQPELMKQWFAPRPWTKPVVETDVRVGGSILFVMRDPQSNDFPNPGVYLAVQENKQLVFTDAYVKAWEPSDKPFMTAEMTFEAAAGGKTNYTARVMHWNVSDREAHEKMGFYGGWGMCADQLNELLVTLK
jgi:uncharacterized protein YndB with AHSA1/START domain